MRKRFLGGLIPALVLAALPGIASAGLFVGVSVNFAPPPLPVYEQPPCPQPGYLWVPGYWAWNDGAYYWVPGTWVLPPEVGLLWTPGYWGWEGGVYLWHAGYWGPHVGFYGGVPYGFGYDGVGYEGGYWHGDRFFYNRAVLRVGPTFVTNVYYHPVEYHSSYEHVSFNGGPGGVRARPTRADIVAEHEGHRALTASQERQQRLAFADRSLRADYNHGRPPIAATARPAEFHGHGAFAARAAGGPVRSYGGARSGAPMRSDRPAWASGQGRPQSGYRERGSRPAQQRRAMRYQPAQREQNGRPPQNFRAQRNFRPQQRNFRAAPAGRGPAPREQRGGGGHPHHPPENRGGGRGR